MENTTPTERRLEITPGEARIGGNYAFHNVLYVPVRVAAPPIGIHVDVSWVLGNGEEARHTASLHADAHNTYNSCHLTPSELLAKLREAAAMIVRIGYSCDDLGHRKDQYHNWDQPCPVVAEIDAFLSNLPK